MRTYYVGELNRHTLEGFEKLEDDLWREMYRKSVQCYLNDLLRVNTKIYIYEVKNALCSYISKDFSKEWFIENESGNDYIELKFIVHKCPTCGHLERIDVEVMYFKGESDR